MIRAATVAELFRAAKDVKPGGTILLADGHYPLPQFLELHTDNVTLRSESGRRDSVVIDGSGRLGELIWISRCCGVTIADLTIQNVKWNGFKLNSDMGVTKVTIYNCVIHNVWQRGIKGVGVPEKDREKLRPTDCRVQYCLFYNDRPKQPGDDELRHLRRQLRGRHGHHVRQALDDQRQRVRGHPRPHGRGPRRRSSSGSTPRTASSSGT